MHGFHHGCDRANFAAVQALPYHDCLGGTSQHLPKRGLKMNLSPPVICNNCGETATDTLTLHFPVYRASRRRRPRPESIRCVLLLWAASVCDGAYPTLNDAAGLPPTEVPASPLPRLAAISSAVGTRRRDSLKTCSTFSWNDPTHNPWVGVNACTTAWLSTPITSRARQSCLGCAQQHPVEQREQLFIVDVSG